MVILALRAPLIAEFIEQALAVCVLVAKGGGVAAQALHSAIIAGRVACLILRPASTRCREVT